MTDPEELRNAIRKACNTQSAERLVRIELPEFTPEGREEPYDAYYYPWLTVGDLEFLRPYTDDNGEPTPLFSAALIVRTFRDETGKRAYSDTKANVTDMHSMPSDLLESVVGRMTIGNYPTRGADDPKAG